MSIAVSRIRPRAAAAVGMSFPEFVPYCLGKAQGRPRRDVSDLVAAVATMPAALGPAWPQRAEELEVQCERAADLVRGADPQAESMLTAGEVGPLSARLASTGFPDGVDQVLSDAFDGLFALVTAANFPAERAEHAWAVIATNPFKVALSSGLFPGTYAVVWWRAR